MQSTRECQVFGCDRAGQRWHKGRLDLVCTLHKKRWNRNGCYELETPDQRFLAGLIFMPSGCIEWSKSTNPDGYGKIQVGGKTVAAHRFAWERVHGEISAGKMVMHSCDNPPCCNTSHMSLGDNAANMQDMLAKGRNWHQQKTHCPQGHPLDKVLSTTGYRYCGECNRLAPKARRAKVSISEYVKRLEVAI